MEDEVQKIVADMKISFQVFHESLLDIVSQLEQIDPALVKKLTNGMGSRLSAGYWLVSEMAGVDDKTPLELYAEKRMDDFNQILDSELRY